MVAIGTLRLCESSRIPILTSGFLGNLARKGMSMVEPVHGIAASPIVSANGPGFGSSTTRADPIVGWPSLAAVGMAVSLMLSTALVKTFG